ncbi:hypothetical protein K505DRAFT_239398 [Melanomma pulvis-pyrius CBS 109.77]|uniref:Fungal N-terminal domain-containing protein n=1 Tax=Melanomma pulvis-pyrius CBS 109.77 TaxID=1314802 RepID=A0A6A6XGP0_9PLEO|nr:hypothetical protein K505DRAFT_239398 [Melanomma pulvis-pyrius CBS 109.77]
MTTAAIPSIGDILMLSQLAWKIGRAFTAGRKGAPPEFLEVETEVNGLAKSLKFLAETLFADLDDGILKQADQETLDGVATILSSCRQTVHDLESLIDRYQVIKKHRTPGGFAIERSWSDRVLVEYKTIMWTTEGGDIQSLRHTLHMHTTTIILTAQALQSKSLSRLESIVTPVAEQIDSIHHRTGSFEEQLEEVHRFVKEIAGRAPQLLATLDLDNRPPSSLYLDSSRQTSPTHEAFTAREYFPSRQSARVPPPPSSQLSRSPVLPQSPDMSLTDPPSSPTTTAATSTSPSSTARKHISEFSFGGSPSRYSDSHASSDGRASNGWPSPPTNRYSHLSRQPSKRESTLSRTPEVREKGLRPDSAILSPLPPPAMDIPPDPWVDHTMAISKLSLNPPTQPEIVRLHRSSTTSSQKEIFEKQAFRNSAILCDVRGTLVEYAQKVSPEEDSHDVEMVEACQDCRICVVRKREPVAADGKTIRMMTSIWVFSDDNIVRLQLKLADGEMYVPYSSYFSPEKISMTVPCELKYHDVKYGTRLLKTAKTTWINYVFDTSQGTATLFQNELMGRTLLGTFRTEQTMRIHDGLSGAFSYAEQMCGMENLRVWEDNDTAAIIALIHFSAHFKAGYLAFYINSSTNPIRIKEEGSKEVKVKGLRVPLEKAAGRKDSAVGVGTGKEKDGTDKRKIVAGAKIEFATEVEKREFVNLVKECQKCMLDLPDLLGVN